MELTSVYAVFGNEWQSGEGFTIVRNQDGSYQVVRPDGYKYKYKVKKFETAKTYAEQKAILWRKRERGKIHEGVYQGTKRVF